LVSPTCSPSPPPSPLYGGRCTLLLRSARVRHDRSRKFLTEGGCSPQSRARPTHIISPSPSFHLSLPLTRSAIGRCHRFFVLTVLRRSAFVPSRRAESMPPSPPDTGLSSCRWYPFYGRISMCIVFRRSSSARLVAFSKWRSKIFLARAMPTDVDRHS